MQALERILFPTDFSPGAAAAWPLLGNVAQEVIRTASCLVLTVRPVERETAEERGAA